MYWISARFPSPNTNIGLFYATALAVALGRSSRVPVLKAFLAVQFRRENPNVVDEGGIGYLTNAWWSIAACFASIISFYISNFPWATRFLISTLVMGANLLLFLSGFAFLPPRKTNYDWEPTWYLFSSLQGSYIQKASKLPKYTYSV